MKKLSTFKEFQGPLRKNPSNPWYFTDDSGKAVYLTGSHTWANFQELLADGGPAFDYTAYLDFMQEYNHNFIRLWMWEQAERASVSPKRPRRQVRPGLPKPTRSA